MKGVIVKFSKKVISHLLRNLLKVLANLMIDIIDFINHDMHTLLKPSLFEFLILALVIDLIEGNSIFKFLSDKFYEI